MSSSAPNENFTGLGTVREKVTPLLPRTVPATSTAPIPDPGEAIQAAVGQIAQAAAQAASAAAAGAVRGVTLGVFHAVATLLAIRLLLLLALAGGFVLAVMALQIGTYQAGGVLVAYAVLIVIPLIMLERNPRVGGGNAKME